MMNTASTQPKIESLKKRADFLRLRHGKFAKRPAFLLQAAPSEHEAIRVGFTCSKQLGNAVARNRAKRRLREVVRKIMPKYGKAGWDYVLIGRSQTTAKRNFAKILREAEAALHEIHSDTNGGQK